MNTEDINLAAPNKQKRGFILRPSAPTPKQEKPTRVIFRKWPKKQGGDVIALFPGLAGTVGDPFTCESYQTIGQHGAASVDLVNDTRKATPAEYADLQKELERVGYTLEIAHRFTRADQRAREEQLSK